VSELAEERLRVRRRDLLGHLRVLETVFAETTVVPCAFGMVLPTRQAVVTEFMSTRLDELRALLDELDGRAQLNVTASYDEEVVLREIVATDPQIARGREETRALGRAGHFASIRLGELVASALVELRAADNRRLLERLTAASEDVAVESTDDMTVLKASFLVSRAHTARFDRVLEELAAAEAPRIRFEAIGPLPPTAFAELGAGG
jgi:Gas vesicle synthesis protein GvpL/GvpF